MMPGEAPRSPTGRFLFWLASAIYRHRRWFFYPQLVLVGLSVFYTASELKFLTNRSDLVGGDQAYRRNFLRFKEQFPSQDDLVVLVESEDIEKNRQFVERLGAKIESDTNIFGSVFFKGDLPSMGPKALLFVPEPDLRDLLKTFREYQPVLQQFVKATNLVSLLRLVNTQFRTATREENPENSALVKALPALDRIIDQATDSLHRLGTPPSPGITALFEGGREAQSQMYITYASNRIYLVTATARADRSTAEAVKRLRELMSETLSEVPGLNVGLTGESVLEVDEMAQSQADTTVATVVSLILVALIFIYGYHETGRPLKATACLLVGLAYTMGFTTLSVGHLNILTITFLPILIGLAIDFGVHLITRYEEELRHGRTEIWALEKAIVFTGMGIFTGAFTTAAAFFAMGATDFKGIQEMGIICGGGMLVCLVPMMTMLPALLLRGRQNVLDHELGPTLDRKAIIEVERRARIENIWLQRPITVVVSIVLITGAALAGATRVRFDYNLLHMQTAGLPAVYFQDKLIRASGQRSVLFGAVIAESLSQATNLIAGLTNLPAVGSVESMAPYLTEDQTGKLAIIRQIKEVMSRIHFLPIDPHPVDLAELRLALFGLHGYCGLAAEATQQEQPATHRELVSLRAAVKQLIDQLLGSDPLAISQKLGAYQRALFEDVHVTFQSLQNQDAIGPLRVQDLPPFLRTRFVGLDGSYLIQVYPKHDLWGRSAQHDFIEQIQALGATLTGTPVQLYEYTGKLKASYEQAAWYSLAAIALMVFIHFRSISCVVLSLLPVGFGFIWLLGIMHLCGLEFNPANVMTLPLMVGIGVTNGIHILNRFAEEQHPSILARSTGKAVLVSGLTTIAGFGSLILAQHRGIRSLGLVMSIGVAVCMVVAITFLPALLNIMSAHGWKIKKTQRDNAQSTLGREEPR